MVGRIVAIVFIFGCTATAWLVLGLTVTERTSTQDRALRGSVGQLWGNPQEQEPPSVWYETVESRQVEVRRDGAITTETRKDRTTHPLPIEASDIDVDLRLEHRRKGLLWYATYRVGFAATYTIVNDTGETRDVWFAFPLPVKEAVYDDFTLTAGGIAEKQLDASCGRIVKKLHLGAGAGTQVAVSYHSQGLDTWAYRMGDDSPRQVRNFSLTMTTDFDGIDFPSGGLSPVRKEPTGNGWKLEWTYTSLLSGLKTGMAMPRKLNPGPWVSQVSFAAPVSLFLFFFVVFIAAALRRVPIHPMNYFFLAAAFFSFHLLLAYLVDHISIHLAFAISSLVSLALVISYMRLVVGMRFALAAVGLAQLAYLVLFSYTFFFVGYTGLAITVLAILTLFIVMQWTGRLRWEEVSRRA